MHKDYSYSYEWDREYCYPNSDVLINKLNIMDAGALSVAEREITSLRLAAAKAVPLVDILICSICKSSMLLFSGISMTGPGNSAM